jgi:hypothetical protein
MSTDRSCGGPDKRANRTDAVDEYVRVALAQTEMMHAACCANAAGMQTVDATSTLQNYTYLVESIVFSLGTFTRRVNFTCRSVAWSTLSSGLTRGLGTRRATTSVTTTCGHESARAERPTCGAVGTRFAVKNTSPVCT